MSDKKDERAGIATATVVLLVELGFVVVVEWVVIHFTRKYW